VNRESSNYKWFVLGILTLVYTFNFIDRQILVILQEPIKADLGLSDTQLGLLTGFSFAVVYVTAGIPIAWLADRSNRRNIVAASLGIFSVMTALSGLVQNYTQLLLARLGVGLGEAGGSPPSHSMLSDYFPEEKRGTAISIYTTGIYFGIFFGYFAGGWIAESFGWRKAFLSSGSLVSHLQRYFYSWYENPHVLNPLRPPCRQSPALRKPFQSWQSVRRFGG
jgi:MFS family permease